VCRDPGDFTDCEEGYWDYGSGCEPIKDGGNGIPCVPGSYCPPCDVGEDGKEIEGPDCAEATREMIQTTVLTVKERRDIRDVVMKKRRHYVMKIRHRRHYAEMKAILMIVKRVLSIVGLVVNR
jgi:hypothetical protein